MLKLLNKKDPLNIQSILKDAYNKILLIYNKHLNTMFDFVDKAIKNKSKELEQLVMLDVNLTQVDSHYIKIRNAMLEDVGSVFRNAMKKSYQRGKATATYEVNRVYPQRQPLELKAFDKKDLKTLRILQDTDFSLIKNLTQKQIALAKKEFIQGLVNNKGANEIKRNIMRTIGSGEYQTRRIVYTELTRTTVTAQRKLYLQSGVKFWAWNTAIDERVCPVCGNLHGRITKIGDDFSVFLDTEEALKKNAGQKILQPPAHPFCRCGMSPMPDPPKQVIKIRRTPTKKEEPKKESNLIGFTKTQEKRIRTNLDKLPKEVVNKVSVLNGKEPIIIGKGSISEIKEAKEIIPEIILNKYIKANGIFVGGNYNRIFLSKWSKSFDFYHEIGHSIFRQYLHSRPTILNKFESLHKHHLERGVFITERSSVNSSEHFADVFSAYIKQPKFLMFHYPVLFNFIEKFIYYKNDKK